MRHNHISFGKVAAELRSDTVRDEFRTNWSSALLYRLPAVPVVWAAARAGLRPTQVSLSALVLALALPAVAGLAPLVWAPVVVFALAVLFQVLDCADGMLARLTGQVSRRGGDADFLIDMIQWGLLYAAIGILADRTLDSGGWGWTALGAAAGWGRLYARVVRDRLSPPAATDAPPAPARGFGLVAAFVAGLSGALPFLALAGPGLDAAVIALAVYSALDVGDALVPLTRQQ